MTYPDAVSRRDKNSRFAHVLDRNALDVCNGICDVADGTWLISALDHVLARPLLLFDGLGKFGSAFQVLCGSVRGPHVTLAYALAIWHLLLKETGVREEAYPRPVCLDLQSLERHLFHDRDIFLGLETAAVDANVESQVNNPLHLFQSARETVHASSSRQFSQSFFQDGFKVLGSGSRVQEQR